MVSEDTQDLRVGWRVCRECSLNQQDSEEDAERVPAAAHRRCSSFSMLFC